MGLLVDGEMRRAVREIDRQRRTERVGRRAAARAARAAFRAQRRRLRLPWRWRLAIMGSVVVPIYGFLVLTFGWEATLVGIVNSVLGIPGALLSFGEAMADPATWQETGAVLSMTGVIVGVTVATVLGFCAVVAVSAVIAEAAWRWEVARLEMPLNVADIAEHARREEARQEYLFREGRRRGDLPPDAPTNG